MEEFLKQLATILEEKKINERDPIKAFPLLDSLGILPIITMLDARYGVNITLSDLSRMNTIGDLWNHVNCYKKHPRNQVGRMKREGTLAKYSI